VTPLSHSFPALPSFPTNQIAPKFLFRDKLACFHKLNFGLTFQFVCFYLFFSYSAYEIIILLLLILIIVIMIV